MSLKCKLGLHSWNGCKCSECGKVRDEQHKWKGCKCETCGKTRDEDHDFSKDCEKCKICGIIKENNHIWEGCICKKCHKRRDEHHNWDGCMCKKCYKTRYEQHDFSTNCEKCMKCGKIIENNHKWERCKCKKCGKIRDEQHDWLGCKCKKCGKIRDEQHDFSKDCGECSVCGKTINYLHNWKNKKCTICGKDINSMNYGQTYLTRLCEKFSGRYDSDSFIKGFNSLIENGADINMKNNQGLTTLGVIIQNSISFQSGSKLLIEKLLKCGASPFGKNIYTEAYFKMERYKKSVIRKEVDIFGNVEELYLFWKDIVLLLYKAKKGIPLNDDISISDNELAIESLSEDDKIIANKINTIAEKIDIKNMTVKSTNDELKKIKSIIDRSTDANNFIKEIETIGFKFEEESPMGLLMETDYSRILLKVKESIHSTNIATLLHMDKETERQTYLIEDGKKEY